MENRYCFFTNPSSKSYTPNLAPKPSFQFLFIFSVFSAELFWGECLRFWHGRPIFLTKTQKKATKQETNKQCKEGIKSKWKAKSETKEGQVSAREVSLQFKKERSILEAQKGKKKIG